MPDKTKFLQYQNKLHDSAWYKKLVSFFGIYGILIIPIEFGFLAKETDLIFALLYIGLAFFLTWPILADLIFYFYKKQRPYQKFGFTPATSSWLFTRVHQKPNSFPSRHMMAIFSVSTAVFFYLPVVGICGLLMGVMIGPSRVVLGYHYPIDIVFGTLFGVISGALVYFYLVPFLFT